MEPSSDSVIIAGVVKRHKRALVNVVAAMAALAGAAWLLLHPRPSQPPPELTQKRLTFNSSENPVLSSAISPDGKYLAFSDSAGIHVKVLSTGDERVIPKPAGVPSGAYWIAASWFPDSTQLLADAQEPDGHASTWTVSVVGQSARQLREGASGWEVSPDGTQIVFRPEERTSGQPPEMWVMDSEGNNPQKVLALGEDDALGSVHWSPDGQRLAYWRAQRIQQGYYQNSLETCDLKGENRTVVVPGTDLALEDYYWLRDGRIVYSRSDSPGSSDDNLWQVRVSGRTGAPIDKPKRITQWAGSSLWGISASTDGKMVTVAKTMYQAQVYLGELTSEGTLMSPPRRLTNDEYFDAPFAWTPDRKAVLFDSNRDGTSNIFRQGINQDTAEPVVAAPRDTGVLRLSPDGAWILYVEYPKTAISPSTPLDASPCEWWRA